MKTIHTNNDVADIASAVVDHAFESNQLRMNEGDIALPNSGRAFIKDSLASLIAPKNQPKITKEFKDAVFEQAGIEDSYSSFGSWHYYRFPIAALNCIKSEVSFEKCWQQSKKADYSHCEAITLPNGERHYYPFKTFEGYERWQTSSPLAKINDDVRQELLYRMGDYYQISPCSMAAHAVMSVMRNGAELLNKFPVLDASQSQALEYLLFSQVSPTQCANKFNGTMASFFGIVDKVQQYTGFSRMESKKFVAAICIQVREKGRLETMKLLRKMESVLFGYVFEKLQDVEIDGKILRSTLDVLHVDYYKKKEKRSFKCLFIKGKENAEECVRWMKEHGLTCSMKLVEHPDYDK